jgi:hypothetical protein
VNRTLDPKKLMDTSKELAEWIKAQLPEAHLSQVADDVGRLTEEAVEKAASIRRPNMFLR